MKKVKVIYFEGYLQVSCHEETGIDGKKQNINGNNINFNVAQNGQQAAESIIVGIKALADNIQRDNGINILDKDKYSINLFVFIGGVSSVKGKQEFVNRLVDLREGKEGSVIFCDENSYIAGDWRALPNVTIANRGVLIHYLIDNQPFRLLGTGARRDNVYVGGPSLGDFGNFIKNLLNPKELIQGEESTELADVCFSKVLQGDLGIAFYKWGQLLTEQRLKQVLFQQNGNLIKRGYLAWVLHKSSESLIGLLNEQQGEYYEWKDIPINQATLAFANESAKLKSLQEKLAQFLHNIAAGNMEQLPQECKDIFNHESLRPKLIEQASSLIEEYKSQTEEYKRTKEMVTLLIEYIKSTYGEELLKLTPFELVEKLLKDSFENREEEKRQFKVLITKYFVTPLYKQFAILADLIKNHFVEEHKLSDDNANKEVQKTMENLQIRSIVPKELFEEFPTEGLSGLFLGFLRENKVLINIIDLNMALEISRNMGVMMADDTTLFNSTLEKSIHDCYQDYNKNLNAVKLLTFSNTGNSSSFSEEKVSCVTKSPLPQVPKQAINQNRKHP